MAIRYKLVPWKRSDLLSSIRAYYEAARDLVPDQGQIVGQGRRLLSQRLEAFNSKREISDFGLVPGYSMRRKLRSTYVIKVEEFNSIFDSVEQADLVLSSLMDHGQIKLEKPRKNKRRPGPKRQFEWPDSKRRRSYLITLPKTGNDRGN